MDNIYIGSVGEKTAVEYLKKSGYDIIECNYRRKTGEIDIIAKDNNTIVFVEVKTRRSLVFGYPSEAVTFSKQKRIIKTALCYLNQSHNSNTSCRFDVLEVLMQSNGNPKINHIANAFQA